MKKNGPWIYSNHHGTYILTVNCGLPNHFVSCNIDLECSGFSGAPTQGGGGHNQHSLFRLSWRYHQHGGGEVRLTARGYWVVAVIGRDIDEPSFFSALLLAFVYTMMKLNSEHTLNRYTRVEGREKVGF